MYSQLALLQVAAGGGFVSRLYLLLADMADVVFSLTRVAGLFE